MGERMKKILIFGSIFASAVIVLASFTSVASYQTAESTILSKAKDLLVNIDNKDKDRLGKLLLNNKEMLNRFKNIDVNTRVSAIQHMKDKSINGGWYPGYFIIILFIILVEVISPPYTPWFLGQLTLLIIYIILVGGWEPGMIIEIIIIVILTLLYRFTDNASFSTLNK